MGDVIYLADRKRRTDQPYLKTVYQGNEYWLGVDDVIELSAGIIGIEDLEGFEDLDDLIQVMAITIIGLTQRL